MIYGYTRFVDLRFTRLFTTVCTVLRLRLPRADCPTLLRAVCAFYVCYVTLFVVTLPVLRLLRCWITPVVVTTFVVVPLCVYVPGCFVPALPDYRLLHLRLRLAFVAVYGCCVTAFVTLV